MTLPTYTPIPPSTSTSPSPSPSRLFSPRRALLLCASLFLLSITFIYLSPTSYPLSSRHHALSARPPYIPAPTFPERAPVEAGAVAHLARIPPTRMLDREAFARQMYYPAAHYAPAYPVRPHYYPPNTVRAGAAPDVRVRMPRVQETVDQARSAYEGRMMEEVRRRRAGVMDARMGGFVGGYGWAPLAMGEKEREAFLREREAFLKERAGMSKERAEKMEAMRKYAEMHKGVPVFAAETEKQHLPLLANTLMNIA